MADVSTSLDLLSTIDAISELLPTAEPLDQDDAAMVSIARGEMSEYNTDELESIVSWDGPWHEIQLSPHTSLNVEMPTTEALTLIRQRKTSISATRIAFRDFLVTWQEPYARFINSDQKRAEIGVRIRSPRQLDDLGRVLRAVSKPGFIDDARPHVIMREHGNAKYYSI
jgi:hypothetical protein